jgi:hypothetical protein
MACIMSLSKVSAACVASLSLATLAPLTAHADERTTRAPLSVEASTAAPVPAPRVQAVASVDVGVLQAEVQVGLRYDWFEADVGVRGYFDSSETYVGLKLLLPGSGRTVVPYFYGQVGNWKDGEGLFSKLGPDQSGAIATGGLGLDIHLSEVVSLILHVGVDHQFGTDDSPTRLEAGLGLGLRL